MRRECKSAKVKNGRVVVGDRVRIWGVDDYGQDALLTGTVAKIERYSDRRVGTLMLIEIVDEDGEYLWWGRAHEFEKAS